jgi:GTP-binding protein EngB required for normal cell division
MSGELDRRLSALAEAVELADGRLDGEHVEAARTVVGRAGQRLGLGVEATVVALAGPTGAGKSSLFNALAEGPLASTGRRRPTTASATAAIWGDVGAALLEWLEVQRRHQRADGRLSGLVLVDLPDFDSVELSHRLEVERLIELVDLVVWVVDPQKYADASLHERYLRPLASYEESMLVALNQSDLLTQDALAACRDDLRALLDEDGLAGVPVLAVSARTGEGLAELREALERRVRARTAAVARLGADVTSVAAILGASCGQRSRGRVNAGEREPLVAALGDAAGVPTVVRAVTVAHRRRGALATGWPFLRWIRRLRPDPLRRLRLSERPDEDIRTSLAGPSLVQRSQIAAATRSLAADAAGDLPAPWPALARSAATASEDELADRLDRAVAGADLHVRQPRWWRAVGLLQTLLAGAAFVGGVWLLVLAVLGYLRVEEVVPLPELGSIPVPTVLLVGGLLAGVVIAVASGVVNTAAAGRRARAAAGSLQRRVEEVADELVIGPLERELAAYDRLCAALETAVDRKRPGRLSGLFPSLRGQTAAE